MQHTPGSASDQERLAERLRELMADEPLLSEPRRARSDPEDHDDPDGVDSPASPDEPEQETLDDARETHRGVQAVREFGRAHLGVIAVVCAALLVFAGSQILRARASTVPDPQTTALEGFGTAQTSSAPPGLSASTSTPPPLRIHVVGAVRTPGVHALPSGARVADAIDAAGGLTDDADVGELNLAAPACDGCQLVIGTSAAPRGELRPPGSGSSVPAVGASTDVSSGQATSGGAARVDINTADAAALEELPGIGPVIAARIVEWRTEHKRFSRVEELQEVTGIGPALFEKVKDHVVVS